MKRNIKRTLFLLIALGCLCGCQQKTSHVSQTSENIKLNSRQKNILSKEGLSTNYDELTASQKSAIISIESMLSYLEDKYDTEFVYVAYSGKSPTENEELTAYPLKNEAYLCKVTHTKDGYADNYVLVAATEMYEFYLTSQIQNLIPGQNIRVFADLTETTLNQVPETASELENTTEAAVWIFLDGSSFKQTEFNDFVNKTKNCLYQHKLFSTVQFVLLQKDRIKNLTKYNFEDFLSDEYIIEMQTIYIKK